MAEGEPIQSFLPELLLLFDRLYHACLQQLLTEDHSLGALDGLGQDGVEIGDESIHSLGAMEAVVIGTKSNIVSSCSDGSLQMCHNSLPEKGSSERVRMDVCEGRHPCRSQ